MLNKPRLLLQLKSEYPPFNKFGSHAITLYPDLSEPVCVLYSNDVRLLQHSNGNYNSVIYTRCRYRQSLLRADSAAAFECLQIKTRLMQFRMANTTNTTATTTTNMHLRWSLVCLTLLVSVLLLTWIWIWYSKNAVEFIDLCTIIGQLMGSINQFWSFRRI